MTITNVARDAIIERSRREFVIARPSERHRTSQPLDRHVSDPHDIAPLEWVRTLVESLVTLLSLLRSFRWSTATGSGRRASPALLVIGLAAALGASIALLASSSRP